MVRLGDLLSSLFPVRLPEKRLSDEIVEIVEDSRRARAGALFVCLSGVEADGHNYAAAAYGQGCRAFLCEYPPSGVGPDAAIAYVPSTRASLSRLAAAFWGHPEREMRLIGITGTKGKSTTAEMIRTLLSAAGVAVGYIGSGGARYADVEVPTENTTPSPLVLFSLLADMRRRGITAAVLEVSSQALAMHRTEGLSFPITVFTNLAPDHIGEGEHPDMAHYREQKARLFSDYGARVMVVDADDENTPFMLARASASEILSFSLAHGDADLSARAIREWKSAEAFGAACVLQTKEGARAPLSLPLPGICNIRNAALALLAARAYLLSFCGGAGAELHHLAPRLCDFSSRGRFERVDTLLREVDFVIDYAHNGYSLAAAIGALRAFRPKRLVCLFGSVGARTYSRRTELARAAAAADFCIVTTDNPDTEPPEDTMRELCRVLEEAGCEYTAIADRRAAIAYAVHHARAGDLVLLAGKGHENYQLTNGRRIPFSERDILVEEAARAPLAAFVSE